MEIPRDSHSEWSNSEKEGEIVYDVPLVKVFITLLSPTHCNPMDCSLCPCNPPGKNTGVDSHALLQGIFLTQGSNSGLQHCRQILYCLSHQRSLICLICRILKKKKKRYKGTYLKNRKRLRDLENELMVARGKAQSGTLGWSCTYCCV